jgi:hypothetical protein
LWDTFSSEAPTTNARRPTRRRLWYAPATKCRGS